MEKLIVLLAVLLLISLPGLGDVTGQERDKYEINSSSDLANLSTNTSDTYAVLTDDINLSHSEIEIDYNLTLDGQGHTIRGPHDTETGIFNTFQSDITVKNTSFKNLSSNTGSNLATYHHGAILVGYTRGDVTVRNSEFTNIDVESSENKVTGLIVAQQAGVVTVSGTKTRDVSVSGSGETGIIGDVDRIDISDSQFRGQISGSGRTGLIGASTGTFNIERVEAQGVVNGDSIGVVGYTGDSEIVDSDINVTLDGSSAGTIGDGTGNINVVDTNIQVQSDASRTGGILGIGQAEASVHDSVIDVESDTGDVGGIYGKNDITNNGVTVVSDSIVRVDSSGQNVGGVAGRYTGTGQFGKLDSTFSVDATGADTAGGIIGLLDNTESFSSTTKYEFGFRYGDIDIESDAQKSGGVIGNIKRKFLEITVNQTSIRANSHAGILGHTDRAPSSLRVENSYVTGDVRYVIVNSTYDLDFSAISIYKFYTTAEFDVFVDSQGGESDWRIYRSYYNILNGDARDLEVVGLGTDSMTEKESYRDWDFNNIWRERAGLPPVLDAGQGRVQRSEEIYYNDQRLVTNEIIGTQYGSFNNKTA